MEIKILGTGCPKCKTLEKNALEAVSESGANISVTKVTNINDIIEYDVMMTPGLVINEKVKTTGKVPNKDEIKKLIEEEL